MESGVRSQEIGVRRNFEKIPIALRQSIKFCRHGMTTGSRPSSALQ
ncbi:hypothetical protein V0288_17555 [Pannus brasiliensis CCIBt3594]|uniref:Uncharacterized protein n=1 Tax=Pannus brasiliensis CCIBt3594 TaxID=1427578 RepID=A0AAW9QXC4_9CHRO